VEPIEQEDVTASGIVLRKQPRKNPKRVKYSQSVLVIEMKLANASRWMSKLVIPSCLPNIPVRKSKWTKENADPEGKRRTGDC
jgi:hypothetical protein